MHGATPPLTIKNPILYHVLHPLIQITGIYVKNRVCWGG